MKKVISVFAVAVAAMLVAARLVGVSAAFAQSSEASSQASSQVPQAASDLRYGAFGHYGLVSHSVGFKEFAPSCCPSLFPNVQNRGFTVGALAEFPIVSGFGIGVRAAYSPLSTNFSVVNSSIPTRLGGTGSGVPRFITISYNIETALGGLDLEPLLHYRIGGLTLYAGARASYFLQANYRQFERLEDETLLYKAENSSIRAESSGRIASIRPLALWVEGGMSYEFALNAARTIFIAPEVFYVHPLGSILQDQPWSFSTIRGGISLRFAPAPPSTPSLETASEATPKPTPTPAPRSSKPPKEVALPKGVLGAKILSVAAVNPPPAGSTVASVTPNAFVDIEEFETTRSRYIAPVVFFGEKSSDIPERYNRLKASDRAAFQLDTLVSKRSAAAPTNMPTNTPASGSANARSAAQRVPDQLAAYYHVLNFVGKRLGLYPQAKITLVGLSDDVREQSSPELARKRADRIKSYLKDVWKVDDKRIAVAVGAASGLALGSGGASSKTTTTTPEQAEEMRRVEIFSDTPEVLAELRVKEQTRALKPPVLRLRLDVKAPEGLRDWKIEAVQSGDNARPLKTFRGSGAAPETLDWAIASAASDSLPTTKDDIILKLEATDVTGKTVRAPLTFLPVDVLTPELKRQNNDPDERIDEVSVYGAVFGGKQGTNRSQAWADADSTTLNTQDAVLQKVQSFIKSGSTVSLTGTVDASNQVPQANSEANAQFVAQALAKTFAKAPAKTPTKTPITPQVSSPLVRGAGVGKTFDNVLPEGRFYNRVVTVEVRTQERQPSGK